MCLFIWGFEYEHQCCMGTVYYDVPDAWGIGTDSPSRCVWIVPGTYEGE